MRVDNNKKKTEKGELSIQNLATFAWKLTKF